MANSPPPHDPKRRWKRWALGSFRLGVILASLACLRVMPRGGEVPDKGLVLTEARSVMPGVTSVGDPSDGLFQLFDASGQSVGWAASTFPQAKKVIGYSGPSELLVLFDRDRKVRAVRFLASADTDGHVKKIREDSGFWEQWNGRPESTLGSPGSPRLVSGASVTSEAMARGLAARFGAEGMDQWFPKPLKPEDLQKWFPGADRLEEIGGSGRYVVTHGSEKQGTVLRSSRMGISARGYNGTSDVIVCLDASGGKVLGVGFLGSRDNEPYINDVRDEVAYTDGFAGKTPDTIIAEDPRSSPSLFTSGASYTNQAVVESVREMLRRHLAEEQRPGIPWKTALALAWIAAGLFCGFHRAGSGKKVRLGFALLSVSAGISLGWMVSQDQLIGWGTNGVDLGLVLPLLALTAVALVVPAFTGKNVYCSRICPHGAAQTLAGGLVKRRFALPRKLHLLMARVPWLTLLAIWGLAFLGSGLPFAFFEPFETWSSGFVAFVPAAIFTVGLLSALFLPQAYCHYGCPTGALLKFLSHSPTAWTRRDTVAVVLVSAAFLWSLR